MKLIDEFSGIDIIGQVGDNWDMADATVAVQGAGAPVTVRSCCPVAPICHELLRRNAQFSGYLDDDPVIAGFFSSVKKAAKRTVSKAKKHVRKAVKEVKKAGRTARKVADMPIHLAGKVPFVGPAAQAAARLTTTPSRLALAVATGRRPDKLLVNEFKQQVKDVKTVGPYAQTVLSFVPGPGQGLSSAIGAGLALAEGKPLNEAMVAGIRSAVPGGPLAQAAFDAAAAAAQGKPLDRIAISALPIAPEQKRMVAAGLDVVRAVADGKKVSAAAYEAALKQLPPEYRAAIPAGIAVGQALVKQRAPKMGDVQKVMSAVQKASGQRVAVPSGLRDLVNQRPELAKIVNQARAIARNRAARQAASLGRAALKGQAPSKIAQMAFPGVDGKSLAVYKQASEALKVAEQYRRTMRQGPAVVRRLQRIAQSGSPLAKKAAARNLRVLSRGRAVLEQVNQLKAQAERGSTEARKRLEVLSLASRGNQRRAMALRNKVVQTAMSAARQRAVNPASKVVSFRNVRGSR